jgi:hypothetical protein
MAKWLPLSGRMNQMEHHQGRRDQMRGNGRECVALGERGPAYQALKLGGQAICVIDTARAVSPQPREGGVRSFGRKSNHPFVLESGRLARWCAKRGVCGGPLIIREVAVLLGCGRRKWLFA